ncbi:hypothetical protein [Kineosporia sp. NBRC 101731]|uniref:hypothetical protein n=1 Tax=Kineosporia sp. NBRC 101731 TaxID=3032199 RepID=UPI0024A18CEF|nr:hypothetical protein [Kineosporia sp. NBRC 101731]GLY30325.1 hypothetical protein Kisp02_36900 [Kineosporia sp. NBRC 101731]
MTTHEHIAFRRCRVLLAPGGPQPSAELAVATLDELRNAGLVVSDPEDLTAGCADRVKQWAAWSRAERGQKGDYSPLFAGFPEQLPTFDRSRLRFGLGWVRLAVRALRGGGAVNDADVRAATDFSRIGWWPASSVPQDPDRALLDREFRRTLPGDELQQLTVVRLVSDDEMRRLLQDFALGCLASPGSLRDDVRADLDAVLDGLLPALPALEEIPFLETRTLVMRRVFAADPRRLPGLGATPDDLLRLFADLTGSDVSLGTTMTYPRFTRAQRRAVVAALEASPRLGDVFRRRGLWLAVARGLHLKEFDAPRVQEVFGRLRSTRRDATSLPSRVEARLAASEITAAVDLLAGQAPGLLVRQLRRLVHLAVEHDQVAPVLGTVATALGPVPPRVLWAAHGQFRDNGATYPRLAINKSGGALRVPGPEGHLAVGTDVQKQVLALLEGALTAHQEARETTSELKLAGARVWIDPALENVLLPDQLRSTAPGLVQVERGSRLALGQAPVLRLFLHWREPAGARSDLDLSLLALDENFRLVEQVSWTNLGNGAMTHSGDLTSAPVGAQEFIDVRLDAARARSGWRYLVPAVYRYSGPVFGELPEAVLGWMLREQCSADHATFDPSTVVNAFALAGRQPQALPMLVDLANDEVVQLDLYTARGFRNSVENTAIPTGELVAGVVARAAVKVSTASAVRHAVAARGGVVVGEREQATVTFGLDDDCTFDARSPQELLTELV